MSTPVSDTAPVTDPGETSPESARGVVSIAGFDAVQVAFGAARLTAEDGWGAPSDPAASRATLRAAVDAGINHIDTADALGPGVSEALIGAELGDTDGVLISTKVGMLRPGPRSWDILGHPNYLRQQVYNSLYRLRRERIDLLYLHRIDPNYPLADQLGALQDLRDAGLVGHLGVSEPTLPQLREVLALEPALAAVQSVYNLAETKNAPVAAALRERGIPFVAYWPLIGRGLPAGARAALFTALTPIAEGVGLHATQLVLAWIFTRAPGSLAVVGSRSRSHLADNVAAAGAVLDGPTVAAVETAVRTVVGTTPFDPRHPAEPAADARPDAKDRE